MALILISRVFVEDIDEFNTEWTEYYFDTENPDGFILQVSVQNSTAFELDLDAEVWTNPDNGDVYTYNGSNGVTKVAGDGSSIYDPPAPPVDLATEYGEKYRFEFTGGKPTDTYTVKIKIYEKAFEGTVEEIEGGADAASLDWENEGKLFVPFRGSRLRVTLKSSVSRKFAPLFESDEREYYMQLLIDDVVKWTGWCNPDIYSEPYSNPPYFSSITFSDGLGQLKNIDMPDLNVNGYTGTISEKDVVIGILQQIALGLDVHFAVNLREDGMDTESAPIEQSFVNMEAFVSFNQGEIAPLDCYAALEKILRSWNAVIFQQDNVWWMVREPELFAEPIIYKRFESDGTVIGTGTISDNSLTFAGIDLKLHRATLDTVPAFRNVAISQEYGELLVPNGNFVKNGTFDTWYPLVIDNVIYGWSLRDWIYEDLTIFPSETGLFLGSVRRVEESIQGGGRNNYAQIYGRVRSFSDPIGYIKSNAIPIVQEAGNLIRAKFRLRCNTTRDSTDNRLVEAYFNVAIKCGTQWLSADSEGIYSWTGTESRIFWKVAEVLRWEEISIPPIAIPEDGNLEIRIYQMVQIGSVSKVKYILDVDDVELGLADNPALANQRIYYKTANPSTYTSKPEEIKIQLGDVATVLSQNAKIIDGNASSGWFRPSETPSKPLAELIAREFINQTHTTRVRLRNGECYTALALLYTYEDAVNEPGKKLLFTGGTWNIKSGRWSPDFVEIDQTETDILIRPVVEARSDSQSQGAGGTDGTGAQNPIPPQTEAPENGIETRGTITFDSATQVDINGYEWMYDGDLNEGGEELNKTITGTPTDFNRIDALVGDDSGNYHWITGVEDENQVLEPAIPSNRRLLEYILRTPAGDNTLIEVPVEGSNFVRKDNPDGTEVMQGDLALTPQAGTLPNAAYFDNNGVPRRGNPAIVGYYTTLEGIGQYSKILTITIDTAIQLNYYAVIEFSGISTNYEKGFLWVQFEIDGSGDIVTNKLQCFGEFDVSKYTLVKTSSTTYALYVAHDETNSFYRFRPASQFGTSFRYVYHNREAKVDIPDPGTFDHYGFTLFGGGPTGGNGITLNGKVIGGVKRLIEEDDILNIPLNWEYNCMVLNVEGEIINDGEINII